MRRPPWKPTGLVPWIVALAWAMTPMLALCQTPTSPVENLPSVSQGNDGQPTYSVDFGTPAPSSTSASGQGTGSSSYSDAISGNPAAVTIVTGSGKLGDLLGINHDGIRFAGINITDANGLLTGGLNPGQWTGDSLTIADLSIDTGELLGWKGGMFGTQLLYYGGGNVNADAGTIMGYNSLDVVPPRTRVELYQLWYRQQLFENKFVIRMGKSVPTYDFNNVFRAVPMSDSSEFIPTVSSALFTPPYVSPTQLGIMPGYYNSATGFVATAKPIEHFYLQYGLFDGNLANGRQTGLEGPNFNGYELHIAEVGAHWTIGSENKPGKIGAGYWRQTGLLQGFSGPVRGAEGMYLFGSQRLYYQEPGQNSNGLSTYYQFAATDSDFIATHRYFGFGLTYFGPIPRRTADSAGFGLAYGKMTNDPNAGAVFLTPPPGTPPGTTPLGKDELIFTWYYQMKLADGVFVQPNLTYIPNPAVQPGTPDAFAVTLRAIILF